MDDRSDYQFNSRYQDAFGEVGGSGGLFECFLESGFVEMVALPRVLF